MNHQPSPQALETVHAMRADLGDRTSLTDPDWVRLAGVIDLYMLTPEEQALRKAVYDAGVDGGMETSSAMDHLTAYLAVKPLAWQHIQLLVQQVEGYEKVIDSLHAHINAEREAGASTEPPSLGDSSIGHLERSMIAWRGANGQMNADPGVAMLVDGVEIVFTTSELRQLARWAEQ